MKRKLRKKNTQIYLYLNKLERNYRFEDYNKHPKTLQKYVRIRRSKFKEKHFYF